jgi:hypothetical protein
MSTVAGLAIARRCVAGPEPALACPLVIPMIALPIQCAKPQMPPCSRPCATRRRSPAASSWQPAVAAMTQLAGGIKLDSNPSEAQLKVGQAGPCQVAIVI